MSFINKMKCDLMLNQIKSFVTYLLSCAFYLLYLNFVSYYCFKLNFFLFVFVLFKFKYKVKNKITNYSSKFLDPKKKDILYYTIKFKNE